MRAASAGSGIGETYLETLDRQRYEEPAEVVRLVTWAVDHVELALLPRLLGVVGSAWRLMIHLDEAEHALHAGLEIARRRDDQKTFREMLQRLSYVVGDRGNLKEALRLAEVATTSSIRLGDRVGAAKALVDQGIWLSRLNQPKATTGTLKMALDWLPRSEKRNRCAALQIIGLQLRQLGELEEAQRYVSEAEREAVGFGEWANGKLTWLKAQILSDLGQLDEATRLLKIVLDTFRDLHHGETALATCDLVRAQLYRGQHAEAWVTAMTMTRLLEPVRHNKIVSAAIRDLLCCGQAGLTLALVEQVEARIESERQKGRPWLDLEIRTPEI